MNTVLTPNAAIGPDGTTSATRLQFPNTSGTAVIQTVFEAGKMYTISIYAKANTTNQLVLVVAGSTYQRKILNLTDRWERYTWTVVPAAGEVNLDLNNDTLADGTVDVLIWGAQVEETSLPTSYIPTGNTSVTREYDQPKISDLSWFNQEKGTFLVEYEAKLIDPASEQTLVFMSDDTINNAFKISRRAGESSATFTFKTPASADILLKATGSAGDWTTQAKRMAVLTYTAQTAAFSDTSGADNTVSGNTVAIPVRFTSLTFGHRNLNSVSTLNGFIRRLTYFRRDLSAAEVAGVTNAP